MLKSKDVKILKQSLTEQINEENVNNLFTKNVKIERIKLSNREELIAVDGILCFWMLRGQYIPLMSMLLESEFDYKIHSVSVDKGAIPYVTNGAHVMRPGITNIDGSIKKGDLVKIQDSIHNRVLAIGRALYDADEIKRLKTGRVIENIHTIKDKIWKFSKEFR
jgi:PUA domain protein